MKHKNAKLYYRVCKNGILGHLKGPLFETMEEAIKYCGDNGIFDAHILPYVDWQIEE